MRLPPPTEKGAARATAPARKPDRRVRIEATFTGISAALVAMRNDPDRRLHDAFDPMWELALAEACNNIAEHAYRGKGGWIRLVLWIEPRGLVVRLCDNGLPMPPHVLPGASGLQETAPPDTLPEGGFGWPLIRHLADVVTYRRRGRENCLTLVLGERRGPPG